MMENKKERFIKSMAMIYAMAFTVCPFRLLAYITVVLLHGFSLGIITYSMQQFFDAVYLAVGTSVPTSTVLIPLAFLIGIIMLNHVFNGINNYLGDSLHVKLIGRFESRLNEKMGKIDPVEFEEQKFLNLVSKAEKGTGVGGASFALVAVTVVIASYVPYMIFISLYLFSLQPLLVISLFLIFIPVLIAQFIKISMFVDMENESAQIRRENNYYERCITSRESYRETRTLGAYGFFMNLFKNTLQQLLDKRWKTETRSVRVELGMNSITLLGYISVLMMFVYFTMHGKISIGAFAAIFASIEVMFLYLRIMIDQQIGGIFNRVGAIKNFTSFLNYPERSGSNEVKDPMGGITLSGVSFSYPGTDTPSINDINLKVDAGETIAIVGENGAGKSTLIRLMTGIYKPTEGTVHISKCDTRKTSMRALFQGTSGVFQNYQRYKLSLKDNIVISDLEKAQNQDDIEKCLKEAGLDSKQPDFKDGLDTMLSVEFEGIDLSGGQWQRVAIARGIFRQHEVIVLDEPTSAIDPMEEMRLYKSFSEISHGKLAVIVTHRLGSARIADRIVVLDKGSIAEMGTHEELMANQGKYAEMFKKQASWYKSATK